MALSPAFRETLDRHGALMKQARMFRAKPQVFERLLAERAGIGRRRDRGIRRKCMPGLASYLRSVSARTASAARQAAQPEEARTDTVVVDAPAYTPEPTVDEHAQVQPRRAGLLLIARHDTEPTWETSCTIGWSATGTTWSPSPTKPTFRSPSFPGTTNLIGRVRDLAEHPRLPSTEHQELTGLLDYHRSERLRAAPFTTTSRRRSAT